MHAGALVARTRPSSTGDYVSLDPCWSWPKPVQQPRVDHPGRRRGRPRRCSRPSPSTPTGGCPIGGSGLAEALPRLRRRRRGPGPRSRIGSGWSPSAPCRPTRSWPTTRRSGIDEVVLRVPSGSAPTMLAAPRRARRLPRPFRRRRWLSRRRRTAAARQALERRGTRGAGRRGPTADGAHRDLDGARPSVLADAARRAASRWPTSSTASCPQPGAGAGRPLRRPTRSGPSEAPALAAAMPFDVVIGSCNPVALPIDDRVRAAQGHRAGHVHRRPTKGRPDACTARCWPGPSTSC